MGRRLLSDTFSNSLMLLDSSQYPPRSRALLVVIDAELGANLSHLATVRRSRLGDSVIVLNTADPLSGERARERVGDIVPGMGLHISVAATPSDLGELMRGFYEQQAKHYLVEFDHSTLEHNSYLEIQVRIGDDYYTVNTWYAPPYREADWDVLVVLAVSVSLVLIVIVVLWAMRSPRIERKCGQCHRWIPRAWNPCRHCALTGHPARLVVVEGESKLVGQIYFVRRDSTTVGRSANNGLVLDVPGVSHRHAGIHEHNGRFKLVDYGSLNGTHVDGARISAYYLRDGDHVMFGPVRMQFRLETG